MKDFVNVNIDRLKQIEKSRKDTGKFWLEKGRSEEKFLKSLDKRRSFSYDIFEEGVKFFNSGLTLDDAPDDKRTNNSFVTGFEHAKRLAKINEMEKNKSR